MQQKHNEFKIGFGFCISPSTILSNRGLPVMQTEMIAYGQVNETAEESQTSNMDMTSMNLSTAATIPSLSTPGEKNFYVFTSEIEGVDEEKLKVAGDAFSVNTLVANKGDKVTVHFYNVDPVKEERHSFTVGDPYKVNIDVAFAESGNTTFTADNTGVFPFYCAYHLPVMADNLLSFHDFFACNISILS